MSTSLPHGPDKLGRVPVLIRDAVDADLDALKAMYDVECLHGYATFHTEPMPRSVWEARLASPHPGDVMLVAVEGDTVLGAAWSTEYRSRAAYDATRECSVYLAAEGQGRGLGRQLYDALLPRLRDAGVHTVLAGIALPNEASVRLHEAVGFTTVGTMREVGRKLDRWIDVEFFQIVF